MPEIPDKRLDDLDKKKNTKYIGKALKSQEKDPPQKFSNR
jgi:hypothetical protein